VTSTGRLIRVNDGSVLLANLEIANSFWTRLKGLQFRRGLDRQSGIVLSPCSSLHTCFMRFPIDVFMLDRDGVVLKIRRQVTPWRLVFCPAQTHAVIETAVSSIEVSVGETLAIA
jgi:uncharacterized membrane protein (UPF0127 family)